MLLKFFAAFAFVMGLMLLLHWALKRGGLAAPLAMQGKRGSRLKVVETLSLDARRRLVLVQCDQQEHLLVLGAERETVIAANLPLKPENTSS